MRIKLTQFSGEKPRFRATQLPDDAGVVCKNARLDAGVLEPMAGYADGDTLVLTGHDIKGVFLWRVGDDEYWLRFPDAVNVIRSPVADDVYRRVYWTGDSRLDGAPAYSYTPAIYTGGDEYPINSFKLGIPAPTSKPTAAVTTPADNPNDEARVYVYTYVGKLGEESAPSPPSDYLIVAHGGATVEVSGLVVDSDASTGREIENIRVYRSAVDSSGNANFYFVGQIAIASNTFTDTKRGDELAEALPSTDWTEPRADMQGLGLTAYGIGYGFSGNIICFTEPFIPYAWPRGYELTTDYPVVAIGAYDNFMIIGTTGRPVMFTGIDPASLSQQELPIIEACVSARSMVSMGHSAIYASPNGLVMAAGGSAVLVTEGIVTKREWASINPSSIHAYEHRGYYVFFWWVDEVTKGGFVFDPRNPAVGLISLSRYFVAGHRDVLNDTLWLIDSLGHLHAFDEDVESPLSFTFKSKEFSLPKPTLFRAARILAESYDDTTLKVYADGGLHCTKVVTSKRAFRLPKRGKTTDWQIEVTGKDKISEICLSETMAEMQLQ